MSELKTASGKAAHPIGIGTWGIGGSMTADTSNDAAEVTALKYSLGKGQNHIDTAEMYGGGHTEEVVGNAIKGINRKDLYIADKVKNHLASGQVRPAVEVMLKKLGTDYLDLLYIHWPDEKQQWREAIPQINELIDEGLVRQFGVSNFSIEQMQEAQAASKHPIAANQMHYNVLYKEEVTSEFEAFCAKHDIALVAYRPVERKVVLTNEPVLAVARAHNATPAQVAIAWLLRRGAVPIPKAVTATHIDENLGALEVNLTPDELKVLDEL